MRTNRAAPDRDEAQRDICARPEKGARDQWTAEKKRLFLEQLGASCNVSASLALVGMTSASLYRLRSRSAAFRAAWDRALSDGYARLEAMMLERALSGEQRAVSRDGTTVVETVACSERLALTLLGLHRRRVTEFREAMTPQTADASGNGDGAAAKRKIATRLARLAASLKREREASESGRTTAYDGDSGKGEGGA